MTLAPSLVRPQMFDRATREWAMSPTRPTVRPSIRPLARRIVSRSSRPCVGCSWAPSPALMIEAPTCWASRCGAPGVGWRTTITSAPIASMFLAVSMNVSPLDRLDTLAEKSCVSAESRLAARLKLVRVRVEFSKNRLKTIRPWSARGPSCGSGSRSRRTTRPCRGCRRSPRATGLPARAGACGSRPRAGPMRARGIQGHGHDEALPGLAYPSSVAEATAPPRESARCAADPHDLVHRVDRPDPDPRPLAGARSRREGRRRRPGWGPRARRDRPGPPGVRTRAVPGRRRRSAPRGRSGPCRGRRRRGRSPPRRRRTGSRSRGGRASGLPRPGRRDRG